MTCPMKNNCGLLGGVAAAALLAVVAKPFVSWSRKKAAAKGFSKEEVQDIVKNTSYEQAEKNLLSKLGSATKEGYMVVGGGQVGWAIIDHLLARGEDYIILFDVRPVDRYEGDSRVTFFQGSMTEAEDVRRAFASAKRPITTVFHTAAIITFNHRLSHQYPLSYNVNVGGTQTLLDESLSAGVSYFIQTSTSHVMIQKDTPNINLSEQAPYTRGGVSHYATSKAEAERRVLSTNGRENSKGVAMYCGSIRPCSAVFGPGDRLFVAPAIEKRESQVMGPWATVDFIFAENVSFGHILMENKMREEREGKEGPGKCAGRAFNVTGERPMTMKEFHDVFKGFFPKLNVVYPPLPIIQTLAWASEMAQWMGTSLGKELSLLTPPVVFAQVTDYTFDSTLARKILGYFPVFSTFEGLKKTVDVETKE
mmetsp:Transcript_29405/g.75805  ORF Transcript_29405/g.75805 Transcript_29405/m.75805 type:complete len:422 (-) Transcript_29405:511-1776(-)|eukprot:CAMPEP_0113873020 /NCGR_PEP_ID=MMETSP0780_2-20120614/3538_1 /TAXON_ID=652834 /ORGANISM="Palpitomonas bilix" /LENGTH=421 /DNA_ID=CAMNT_0000858619 /DNA_START=271 /DNA_END=1536 /DNA_ORIENTATION=- /assembly_acc=CAM_ASM_000599